MTPLVRVCALGGALFLTGCSSMTPSWDWVPSMPSLSSGANVSLTIESDPPGADARTSTGATCRTPCMIPVPGDREFTVSFSLNGYLPTDHPGHAAHGREYPARPGRSAALRPLSRSRRTRSMRSFSQRLRPPRPRSAAAGRKPSRWRNSPNAEDFAGPHKRLVDTCRPGDLNQRPIGYGRAFSSAGERSLHTGEVVGSIPTTPTIKIPPISAFS